MSHRRYKVGLHPPYDKAFDNEKGKSPFLNPKNFSDEKLQASHKDGLECLILEWEGNKNGDHKGQFYNPMWGGAWQNSRLLNAKEALAAIDVEFEDLKAATKRSGKRLSPDVMPPALIEKRLRCEAKLDIVMEEIDALRKELTKWQAKEKKIFDDNILKYGPQGAATGDPPREIDFQPVIQKDGDLVINCKESPYDQMKLPDYYEKVVYPFLKARRAAVTAFYSLPPEQRGPNAPNPMGQTVERSALPARPEGV